MSMEKRSTALVIKSTGSWYALRDVRSGRPLAGRIRGSLRLRGSRSTRTSRSVFRRRRKWVISTRKEITEPMAVANPAP